jgi:hypothetical protein
MVYKTQNYWVFGPFPSSGILENRKQVQFPKSRAFYFQEYWTMEKVHKPSNSNALLVYAAETLRTPRNEDSGCCILHLQSNT